MGASPSDIAAIVAGRHGDPFAVLGPHRSGDGWVVRAFVPGARRLTLVSAHTPAGAFTQSDAAGFFEIALTTDPSLYSLRAENDELRGMRSDMEMRFE